MSLLIIVPKEHGKSYITAGQIFADMYKKITDREALISAKDDCKSNLVLIGSDSVNDFLMNEMLEGNISDLGIRYGTDDYCIRTYKKGQRNILILAGGRARSTIYAVYGYFEKFLGCRYFWDGDVIAKNDTVLLEGIDVTERPRFDYRGLRYFAHRGLKRFQAEHWSFEDWQRELDWMMKKRLNFFMLRIGMDDVWQRAFPENVPYPKEYYKSEMDGYDDRSDFWTLQYRGKLREKVMRYARLLDIMSPTDTGTMTHWYSRTPQEFLDSKKPTFLEQADNQYIQNNSGRIFDFRLNENMEYYTKLTKTMASEYDDNNYLFHTIGLGERKIFKDNNKNFILKKICYRKIGEYLRKEYPNSMLMIGTWDFVGWWQPTEVQKLIKELDPQRTIILDYTSEGSDKIQNFTSWGFEKKFPWIFGLFHAYESESELRGPYYRTEKRLKRAADDEYCKGMILWPELSHSDPIVLEYLSENAWSPNKKSLEEIVKEYSIGRYGRFGEQMNECWQRFIPFMKLSSWGGYTSIDNKASFTTDSFWYTHSDLFVKPVNFLIDAKDSKRTAEYYEDVISQASKMTNELCEVITILAKINAETDNLFIQRDSIDIVRTICGRYLNYIIAKAAYGFGIPMNISNAKKQYLNIISLLADLLWFGADFSIYDTLKQLAKTAPVNPEFEKTLKNNITNVYCIQYCSELVDNVCIEEGKSAFEWLEKPYEFSKLREKSQKNQEKFKKTPLASMQRKPEQALNETMLAIAKEIKNAGVML